MYLLESYKQKNQEQYHNETKITIDAGAQKTHYGKLSVERNALAMIFDIRHRALRDGVTKCLCPCAFALGLAFSFGLLLGLGALV